VDYEEWSPAKDPFIKVPYQAENLSGKRICKADLQQAFRLPVREEVPVLGMISRLIDQKGFDLMAAIMDDLAKMEIQFVLLGTGEEKYHLLFENLAQKHPDRFGIRLGFDNALAHKIEAGADMFLMPSRFEPCGLNQIYSLKYGTVPIVRATGGLDDTIQDYTPKKEEGNGFKFQSYTAAELLAAIQRALEIYRSKPTWEKLMVRGMTVDFSWRQSARAYLDLYQKTRTQKNRSPKQG